MQVNAVPPAAGRSGGSARFRVAERTRRGWFLPAVIGLTAFGAYLATLSRGVLGGDAGELQFVPPILSLTHPTGYPLQVLLHYAWSLVPPGSVAYRLNLLDAAFAAAAVGVVVALARALGISQAGSALAGLSLAFGELWWSQAVRGDKYTLNGLSLALVLWLFVRWRSRPDHARLSWLAGVFGLSLTHHRSMLLVLPALVVGLLLARWRPHSAVQVIRLTLLAACPLLLYAYVPWAGARGLPPGSWPVDTPTAFVEFLLDRGYTSALRPDAAFQGRLLEEAWVLVRSFGPLGAALGVIGLAAMLVRQRVSALVLLLAFLPQAILGASYLLESNYQLPRHWVFFLPGFLIWSVWLGAGFDALAARLTPRIGRVHRWLPAIAFAAVLLIQGGSAWARGAIMLVRAEAGAETMDSWRQDFQRSPVAERFGRLAFDLADPNSIIVCDWEQATVLWYLQRVEGRRPDIAIVYPIERLDAVLAEATTAERTVYISRTLPGIETRAITSSHGPLVRVKTAPAPLPGREGEPHQGAAGIEPLAFPPHARELSVHFQGGLNLLSVALHSERVQPGSVIPFTLYWQRGQPQPADPPIPENVAISVRLLGPGGSVLAAHDERHPVLGTSPTGRWAQDAIVGDYHELPVGAFLRPGAYHIEIVPYLGEPHRNIRPGLIVPFAGQTAEATADGISIPVTVEARTLRGPLDLAAMLLGR